MSEDNLKLWESVSKTDPSATKNANVGGRDQTSINGYWMIKQATDKFGLLGIGWGYEVLEERWDNGALIAVKVTNEENRLEQSKTHTIKIKLWYVIDGKKGEVIQYGHTPAIYRSKYGVSDDGEAPKKSLMDAIKKSLSMLGFSADIFTGMFEDENYVNQLKIESEIEKAEDKDIMIKEKREEITAYIEDYLKRINESKSEIEVNGFAKIALRHLEGRKKITDIADICDKGLKAIALAGQTKKQELKNDSTT